MPEESAIPDDPMILAGEYALRVLEGAELAEAQRRTLADPEFAEMVEWWQAWLAAMAEEAPPIEPSPRLWQAIEARLAAREVHGRAPASLSEARERRGPAGWSIGLAAAGVAAMVAALFIGLPGRETPIADEPAVAVPSDQLIVQLASEDGTQRLAGRIDPAEARLALNISGFDAAEGQSPELWVIPEGGAPVSLGLIPENGTFSRELNARERELIVRGATLAVTFEDRTGAPHEAPTPPILVAGTLDSV